MGLNRCIMYLYSLMLTLKYIFSRISKYHLSGEKEKFPYVHCIQKWGRVGYVSAVPRDRVLIIRDFPLG